METIEYIPFNKLLKKVIDNRGKTCPTENVGIPLIATNCISNEKLYPSFINIRFISQQTYKNWFRGHPEPGDMIFVLKGTPGRVAWVPSPVNFCIAQDMVAIRADEKKIYPKYLFAVLRSSNIQQEIEGLHVGTLIPHFKKSDFDQLLIPCCSKKLQKYIGDIYFYFSQKIDLLHRQNATLELMAETLFRQWFIEEAQEEWKEFSVSDFVRHKKETISPQNLPSQTFYQYSIPAFDRAKSPEICLGRKILSNKFIVTENMLLVSKLNPQTPRVWLIIDRPPLNSVCSTEFITISPYKEENIFFLFCLFSYKPTMSALAQAASGTSGSHQRVKPGDILSIKFLSPSTEYIAAFSKTVSHFFKKIKSNQQQIQTLEKLRDTLLPKLMSGEVRVRVDE